MAGAWNVPAGTQSKLKVKSKDWNVVGGAIEHKNRPEAVYVTISSWVTPKLSVAKAKATSTPDPQELIEKTAVDFKKEVERAGKKFASCFDSKYFDTSSIMWFIEYAAVSAKPGKRQFFEIEINIDTVNAVDYVSEPPAPAPNPGTGKIEMYSYKDLESKIAKAIDKILSLEVFDSKKSLVTFTTKKGAK